MDNTILDRCDLEEYTKEELYDLYKILIIEIQNRKLLNKFETKLKK